MAASQGSSSKGMTAMGAVNAVLLPALAAVAMAAALAFAALATGSLDDRREAVDFTGMGALLCLPGALLYSLGAMLVLRRRPRPRRSRLVLAGVLAGLSYLVLGALLAEAPVLPFLPASAAWTFLVDPLRDGGRPPLRDIVLPLCMMAGALLGGAAGGAVLHAVGWRD